MRCFGDFFEKNIDVDVFDDVLQNAKHRANDASNDVNRPPLTGYWLCSSLLDHNITSGLPSPKFLASKIVLIQIFN